MDSAKNKIDSTIRELKQVHNKNKDISLSLQDVKSEYNSDIIEKAVCILALIGDEITKIGEAISHIENSSLEFSSLMTELSSKIDSLADEFAEIKREIKDDTLDVDGYVKMTEELETYKEMLRQLVWLSKIERTN